MSLAEDVYGAHAAPALAVLLALFALGGGFAATLGEALSQPAVLLLLLAVVIGCAK